MIARGDVANAAVRLLLHKLGEQFDRDRGLAPFRPTPAQRQQLAEFFDNRCCYCGVLLSRGWTNVDHLVPANRKHGGLHAWGNVVPCCASCNSERGDLPWRRFLQGKFPARIAALREREINSYVRVYGNRSRNAAAKEAAIVHQRVSAYLDRLIPRIIRGFGRS